MAGVDGFQQKQQKRRQNGVLNIATAVTISSSSWLEKGISIGCLLTSKEASVF